MSRLALWVGRTALVLLVVAMALNNYAWIAASEFHSTFDIPVHSQAALRTWHALQSWDFKALLGVSKYGPVGYLPAAALFSLYGPSFRLLYLSTTFWIPVYAASLYYLGNRLYGSGSGLLACLYLFTVPLFVFMAKEFPLEMASHALSVLAAAVLVASGFLRRRLPSLAFGLVLGLGGLTKPEFLALWSVPVAFLGLRLLLDSPGTRARKLGMALAVGTTGMLGVLGYLVEGPQLLRLGAELTWFFLVVLIWVLASARLLVLAFRTREVEAPLQNLAFAGATLFLVLFPTLFVRDLGYVVNDRIYALYAGTGAGAAWFDPLLYVRLAATRALDLLHLALFGVGLAVAAWRRDLRHPGRLLVLGMVAWGFLLINVPSEKTEEHLFNLLGFVALVATGWAPLPGWRARVLGVLLALWGGLTIFGWLVPPAWLPDVVVHRYGDASPFYANMPSSLLPILPNPPADVPPVYDQVVNDLALREGRECVLVVPVHPGEVVHQDWFRMFATYGRLPVLVPENRAILQERLDERGGARLFLDLPVYLVADLEEARPARYYREAFDPDADVEAERVAVYAFPPNNREVAVYRLSPRPAPGS